MRAGRSCIRRTLRSTTRSRPEGVRGRQPAGRSCTPGNDRSRDSGRRRPAHRAPRVPRSAVDHHRSCPLVTQHVAGLGETLEHEMKICSAYAAVGDLDENFLWSGLGNWKLLHLQSSVTHVDRCGHRLRYPVHHRSIFMGLPLVDDERGEPSHLVVQRPSGPVVLLSVPVDVVSTSRRRLGRYGFDELAGDEATATLGSTKRSSK